MDHCTGQPACSAGDIEPPEDPPIDVPPESPEANRRSEGVRHRDRRDRQPRVDDQPEGRRQQTAEAEAGDRGDCRSHESRGEEEGVKDHRTVGEVEDRDLAVP